MGSAPLEHRIMVMAMTAADDCTQNVSTPPRSRKVMVVRNDSGSNDAKKLITASLLPKSISWPVILSVPKPSSRNDRPKRKSPIKRYFFI